REPDRGGRVAVELLLLPGGASAAGLPLVLRPARARRRLARPRRPLPRLPQPLREPRLAQPRRRAVSQRRGGRGRRTRLRRRRPADARGVPRGALFRAFRRPQALARIAHPQTRSIRLKSDASKRNEVTYAHVRL